MKSSSMFLPSEKVLLKKGLLTFVSRLFLFLSIYFLLLINFSWAQSSAVDPVIKSKANEMILQIYNNILTIRNKYPELSDFSEKNLLTALNGNYVIKYTTFIDVGVEKKQPFEFGVSYNAETDPNYFEMDEGSFDFSFPILQIKISGYEIKTLKTKQFDIQSIIDQFGQDLWDLQQNYIALKLEITSSEKKYKIDEPIEFTVKLTNNTGKIIKIKDFDEKTMYFMYNRKIWGTRQLHKIDQAKVKDYVLQPNQSLSRSFIGNGIHEKQKVSIYASYGMTFKGVKPTATLSLEIID